MISFNNHVRVGWNQEVAKDDSVIIIGDVGLANKDSIDFYNSLNGEKILIIGNHDEDKLEVLSKIFKRINRLLYYQFEDGTIVACKHIYTPKTSIIREPCDMFIHGHTHEYNSYTFLSGIKYMQDKSAYNASIDLNNYMPVTIKELKYNKPYQLQMFEKHWYKI
jgi:calcineurin-like phosphoesterase family protein